MGSEDLNDQGDFNAKIASAVDDLFNAVRQIEIDPKTNEVKEMGPPAAKPQQAEPTLELESKEASQPAPAAAAPAAPAPSTAPAATHELLAKLDQALMTLDWEVSRSNAGNMRDLLDKAARQYDLGPLVAQGGVIFLMHKLLTIMSEAPESVPTSGPLALKSSLAALKSAAQEGQPYSAETRTQLEQAENALRSVLPSEGAMPSAVPTAAAAPPPPLPQEFQVALKNHIGRLSQLVSKRLVPVENFFGKTPSLAKLHVVIKAVRSQLAEQCEQLKRALSGQFSNVMPVADPVSVSINLGNQCQMLMQYHLQVLNHCARRIAPIEKLFADLEGQQKLHAIHFEIRSGLMAQLQYIASALDGDFGPLPPLPKLAPAAPKAAAAPSASSAPAPSASTAGCPWPTLMVGRWRGEHVAFIPSQVCFDGKGGISAKKVARKQSLQLGKLKSWPWSGLKKKFRGSLAEKSNKELASLEFPVLDIPVAASGRDGKNIVVLFHAAKGGVVLVDYPLEDLEINEQYEWVAKPSQQGDLVCGTICSDFGDPIPVIDISRL